jgi:hypothetical protein
MPYFETLARSCEALIPFGIYLSTCRADVGIRGGGDISPQPRESSKSDRSKLSGQQDTQNELAARGPRKRRSLIDRNSSTCFVRSPSE